MDSCGRTLTAPIQTEPCGRADERSQPTGGRRIDLLLGLNLYAPSGILKGQRLAVEAGAPVYQSLDGPALQMDWLVRVGWQWIF